MDNENNEPPVIVEGNPGSEPPEWFRKAWHDFEQTGEYQRNYGSEPPAVLLEEVETVYRETPEPPGFLKMNNCEDAYVKGGNIYTRAEALEQIAKGFIWHLQDEGREIPNDREIPETLMANNDASAPLDAHYTKLDIQPTEAALRNDLDACQHHLTKYIWRWNLKAPRDGEPETRDLRAARKLLGQYIHYVEEGEWLNHEDLPRGLQ